MKLLSVVSARPNFVKLAAIHHAIVESKRTDIEHLIVHTGQHYDPLLSDVFFEQLKIPQPDENLGVHGGTREEVIERTKAAMIPVLKKHKPDTVLVYGDVNGAVGGAQAAKELGIRLAHIEAGLRSGDLSMPEEHNRIAVDQVADLLFCTEQSGMDHLEKEGVPGERFLVGNTMIDTLTWAQPVMDALVPEVQRRLPKLQGKSFGIATIHRPSNVDDPHALQEVITFLQDVAIYCPIALPAHPRLQKALDASSLLRRSNPSPLLIIPPMDYLRFITFMRASAFILTDSGGIQEEAVLLRKRCFTLRRNTERPSTVESGSNILIDPNKEADRQIVIDYAKDPKPPHIEIPPFWDGKAGKRIIDKLS